MPRTVLVLLGLFGLLGLAATAHADAYRFDHGARVVHDHACTVTPGTIDAWVTRSTIAVDSDRATLFVKGAPYPATTHAPPYETFAIDDATHVQVKLDAIDCVDIHCHALVATYTVIRWRDGAPVCYEQWRGTAIPIPPTKRGEGAQ